MKRPKSQTIEKNPTNRRMKKKSKIQENKQSKNQMTQKGQQTSKK